MSERAWCVTEQLPAQVHCAKDGHQVLQARPTELESLKGRVLVVIEDALDSGQYKDGLLEILELVK